MELSINEFQKRHDKVICLDSDGTVIDAMNCKHIHCHGASFIEEWGLAEHAEEVQNVWNSINLFEETRGVNRFIALVEMLRRMDGKYLTVDPADFEVLKTWVEKGDLSNKALEAELEVDPNPLLQKAHRWSLELNRRIARLTPDDKPPFPGVREALQYARGKVDIAIISSSNMAAIVEEWKAHDLLQYVDVITSQEIGTKDDCIATLLTKGYDPDCVLMCGDAYPDVRASESNGVWYYPVLTRREGESWGRFRAIYFDAFLEGRYGDDQEALMKEFKDNFSDKGE